MQNMNVRNGAESPENVKKALLPNGFASSSSPNLSNQYSNGQSRQMSNVRTTSAKYYDVASTILGGSRDVEEVFLNTAKNGDVKKLDQLLNRSSSIGLDIDCKDKRTGNTALIWAAKRGHVKIVESLLKSGVDVTLCNHEAQTALETAHSSVRTILLDWVDNPVQMNEKLLLQAAWQGNLSAVKKILTSQRRTLNLDCQNSEGLTPLMLVVRDVQLFERLSIQLNRHYSPVQVSEELIKAHADTSVTDADGRSCLHYVSMSKASCTDKLVSVFIAGGANLEAKDKNMFTAMHLASQLGHTNTVIALAEGGSEVNVKGFAGSTPLHLSAYNDHQKTATTLISYGADVLLQDDRGLISLDLAKTKKMKNLLKEAMLVAYSRKQTQSTDPIGHHNSPSSNFEITEKNNNIKQKAEIKFEDLKTKNSSLLKPGSAKNRVLSTVEKCKQAEKKILEEVEALKAAHPVFNRETTRILGTTRSKILPQIGRSTSPIHVSSQDHVLEHQGIHSEDARQQLQSRGRSVSDIKLGLLRQSSQRSSSEDLSSPVFSRHPSIRSIAESCDIFLSSPQGGMKLISVNQSSPSIQKSIYLADKTSSPDDDVFFVPETPVDLFHNRLILKEEFNIEDSRLKDPTHESALNLSSPQEVQQGLQKTGLGPLGTCLMGVRPQIRNPKKKVRCNSDNSLSSSLDSESDQNKNPQKLKVTLTVKKSYSSETSSSLDSFHKSQSLEILSPRLSSQLNYQASSHSDDNIALTTILEPTKMELQDPVSKHSRYPTAELAISKVPQHDLLHVDITQKPDKAACEKNTVTKQNVQAKPFSGKAKILLSADFDNWDNKSSKLYFFNSKKVNTISKSSSIDEERSKGSKSDVLNSDPKLNNHKNCSQQTNQSVTSFSTKKDESLLPEQGREQEPTMYFIVSKESEATSDICRKQLEEKNVSQQNKETVSKSTSVASAKKKSVEKAASIERTIIKNQKSGVNSLEKGHHVLMKDESSKKSLVSEKVSQSKHTAKLKVNIQNTFNCQNSNKGKNCVQPANELDTNAGQVNAELIKQVKDDFQNAIKCKSSDQIKNTLSPKKDPIMATPVIVDPYEEFPQPHVRLIENSTCDAIVKLKKSSINKNHKKSSKRPVSGSSRQSSAGKKRVNKGKAMKAESQQRPKSSKKAGKLKHNESKEEVDEMYNIAESEDVVLVSGIGWQLSTSCVKTPADEALPKADVSSDFVENKFFLEAFKEKILENSPRFLETKQHHAQAKNRLPIEEDGGYPSMILDLAHKHSDTVLNGGNISPEYNVLTPITELSANQSVDNFYRSQIPNFSATKVSATVYKRTITQEDGQVMLNATFPAENNQSPSATLINGKDLNQNNQSQDKVERYDEDNMEEVIEEILNSTSSSLTSGLKLSSGAFTGSNSLTYGDRKFLGQLSSFKWDSPFHAHKLSSTVNIPADKPKNSYQHQVLENVNDIVRPSSDRMLPDGDDNDQKSTSLGNLPSVKNLNNFDSKINFPVNNFEPLMSRPPLSGKEIPLRRSSSTKFYKRREQAVDDEESKQLAKVINSFKQMELTTSGRQEINIKSPIGQSAGHLVVSEVNLPSRNSSANTSFKIKGKFQELKENKKNKQSEDDDKKKNTEEFPSTNLNDAAYEVYRENSKLDSLPGGDNVKGIDDIIHWKKGNILGRGAFGTVWCGLTNEGQLIAVKQIELTTIDHSKAKHEYAKVQEEVELLKTLEHPNIVGYLGTSLEDNVVSIFMQFIPGGSLASILARFGALEESVFRRYTKQIIEGVKYLHDNDVIHRDLKGANVMLMPNGVIKLIDFGCAKRLCINLSISQVEILKSMKGTPFWMAPEVVNETGHGKKSDIWSIGCTVFEMATRNPPWSDMNPMAAIFAIGSAARPVPELDEKFSPEARHFVSQCLMRDQNVRPDAASLLEHPFISKKSVKKF